MNTSKPLKGELLNNEPLARYTTWRVGGVAEQLYKPAGIKDLQAYLQSLDSEKPVLWLGLGSNVLIRDGGVRGSVIYTRGCLNKLHATNKGEIYVEAGVPCAHVAKLAAEKGMAGAEFLAGIPGTMGGALAMNAGAFGGETWELVSRVLLINKKGELIERDAEAFEVEYRNVKLDEGVWFVGSYLVAATTSNHQQSREKIRQLLAKRSQTQPTNMPNAGSVFKNPLNGHAAQLIEACGLKGYSMGGAKVSEKHANFIINTGEAKAADIEQLIEHVEKEVLKKQGVRLKTEVRIMGEAI